MIIWIPIRKSLGHLPRRQGNFNFRNALPCGPYLKFWIHPHMVLNLSGSALPCRPFHILQCSQKWFPYNAPLFSLELDMYPPHPHEYSVEMIEFLLNDTNLMDSLNWQVDSSRVSYSSPMFNVPSPLFYRSMSKWSNSDQIIGEFFDTSKIWSQAVVVKSHKEPLWKVHSVVKDN